MVSGLLAGALTSAVALLVAVSVFRHWLPDVLWFGVAAGVTVLALLADAGRLRRRILPSARRQVPQWVPSRGLGGIFQFGFEIGTGLRTHSPTHLPHLVAAWALIYEATLTTAVVVGLAFGLARATAFLVVNRGADHLAAQAAIGRLVGRPLMMSGFASAAVLLALAS